VAAELTYLILIEAAAADPTHQAELQFRVLVTEEVVLTVHQEMELQIEDLAVVAAVAELLTQEGLEVQASSLSVM
jgi:hypothetical protein